MIKRIRNSLSIKITLFFLLVALLLLGAAGYYAYRRARVTVTDSYGKTADVVVLYGENCMEDYVNDYKHGMQELKQFASQMQNLCQNGMIQMVFIVQQNDEQPQVGDIITLVTDTDLDITGKDDYSYSYEFDANEQRVLAGEINDIVVEYTARVGDVFAFVHGFQVVNDETGVTENYIVGMNIYANVFQGTMGRETMQLFLTTAAVLLIAVVLLGIYIRFKVVKPFKKLSSAMNGFIQGNKMSFEPLEVKGGDERAQVMEDFNAMAEDIRSYVESVKEYEAELQRNIAELSIAADIQRGLLPNSQYISQPFFIKGYMHQAKNVGGDLYYYQCLDENRVAFAIGDVSGKGISAALFMASTVSAIRYNLRQQETPAAAIRAINNDIVRNNPNRLFVTLFVGILNAEDHTLTYSNAGHNPPYLIGESVRKLEDARGVLAGIFEEEEYEDAVISIRDGDQIFLYTDGVTEAMNAKKEFFETQRMEQVLASGCEDVIQAMTGELKNFTDGTTQYDDITMLTLQIKNNFKE